MLDLEAILARARATNERAGKATPGPWYAEENDACWQLFAEQRLHGQFVHPLQLLKAPKRGTPYAEYWPTANDGALIANAREDVPAMAADVEALVALVRNLERTCEAGLEETALPPEPPPGKMRVTASVTYDVSREQIAKYLRGSGWNSPDHLMHDTADMLVSVAQVEGRSTGEVLRDIAAMEDV